MCIFVVVPEMGGSWKNDNSIQRPSVFFLNAKIFDLGKGLATKSDEFSEKFQTAFDPPLIFGNYVTIFFMIDMVAYMQEV